MEVLVTVAIAEGSVPRDPGTRMLVDADTVTGTIGGGHLELRAIEIARTMLAGERARHFERFALGPGLGQCCGGVVHLLFERTDTELAALLRERAREDSWRMVAIDGAPDAALFDATGARIAGSPAPAFVRGRGSHVMRDETGRRWLADAVFAPRSHLVLFGAGHVGAAIVRALADLPCTVSWVDERDDMFPRDVPANVTVEATDMPEALVAAAPEGASYLVMTHSHALDQRLTEAIMARKGVGWFGLIGSHTKRKQFEHRLRDKGVDPARIEAMVCPIGLPGITNKAPAVIAASVCAQLLGVWEAQEASLPKIERERT
ncbi:xanthine dehydrogenase accessory protein XdhC [Massilia sp. RP-1-19]|uniref:Xanthine dehydrogenase accessory protein XdhC n=1 Tax=Massilia polaris TaxID=2728846 RepID=A0A848HSA2_9BURK|nr:xanthine dehydrogenase accessory protein XdhC [Massilia polaris]NML62621.1 xanthine dehydrogenase accessory protein XdhC [Massilia polaris]